MLHRRTWVPLGRRARGQRLSAECRPLPEGEGSALVLEAAGDSRWPSLAALADVLGGGLECAVTGAKRLIADRSARLSSRAEAGITVLHTTGHDQLPEIWCRCDGGPHGSLRIPTHAHAAALSVEVRYGGVEILADPGTYCYQGDPRWRSYFRSRITNDTAGIGGRTKPIDGGRFPWSLPSHAKKPEVIDYGDIVNWAAEHDGYLWLDSPVRHRRSVLLDRASRIVDIVDQIDGDNHDICPEIHFGPEIEVELVDSCAFLSWPASATPGAARLELPLGLSWSLHHAETETIPGWYANGLGRHLPAVTLLGRGRCVAGAPLAARLEFNDAEMLPNVSFSQAVSWSASGIRRGDEQETQAEAR